MERDDRIFDKLDKIETHLTSVDVTLARQEISLAEHIRRTNIIEEEMKPLNEHVALVNSAFRIIGFISVIAGIVTAYFDLKR